MARQLLIKHHSLVYAIARENTVARKWQAVPKRFQSAIGVQESCNLLDKSNNGD